ncbi:LysR family transcriptional regulator [Tropicimonas sediminicola]|uniref:DNA-binding transcriptional regulator, LysR family n=1 Tax=Tropicimonas sediminicola TaxID=1031541 RepID=A0A239LNX7_9RHOB|nr:LysR family transcriptional regulator [Tropicimonas sediminicola]SNT32377.1 DNA-binding transcriptional regulator, LysR family [Tropicimonas sediminicola]
MEFTALRYFHETARAGSIRRAAEVLHVTASSVSRAISALEHELGAPLFERSRKGVTLTDAGTLLSRHTQKTFRDLERVKDAIDDLRGLHRGQVTLYAAEGLVAEFLPAVISAFTAKHPQIGFEIRLDSTDGIVSALLDDIADIGITFNGPHRNDIATVAEHVEPLCCIVRPGHPLDLAPAPLRLSDVLEWPLALPEQSFGMRRMVDAAIARLPGRPRLAINTNSLELTKRVAMNGDAVAFMPAFMVGKDIAAGRLRALRIECADLAASRITVCVHRDRELSFAAKALSAELVAHFEAIPRP